MTCSTSHELSQASSIDLRPVTLSKVIEAALEALRPSFEGKGVKFETVFEPGPSLISGDANRL